MLAIQDFSVSYQKGTKVIENLSLNLIPGKIHGIVGLNGSGKTTFLKALYGSIPSIGGSVHWEGKPVKSKQMAFLETHNFFYHKITGQEYLRLFQMKNPAFDIEQWNRLFDLPLNKLVDNYSTGMKKKLAFLGILALDRPILILDEPYNGVDVESYSKIQIILRKLAHQGKTILITSHIFESLVAICDQISLLKQKQIIQTFEKATFAQLEKEMFDLLNEQTTNMVSELLMKNQK
ncbi:MAG TPA: hypothetical protein DCS93_41630 [Microscillaceae bacterium]|nr:hypothetical protein [Microscillaceae bacterium]